MSEIVSEKFLKGYGFTLKSFPDGNYWVRFYTTSYFMQVDEGLTDFTVCGDGWVESLTSIEFIDIVKAHQKAIDNQE